jgi:glycerol-3-phosphate O-acyltransferase
VVGAPLVAVANAPAGVQQLVGQVQDLVIQHVAVQNKVPETPMEVEDEDAMLERLFFKRYGRALPETEKEKENDVDNIKFVIDLTDEDEMEVATSEVVPVTVVKTEPIEAAEAPVVNVANVADAAKRRSFRLERLELAKARKAITEFGKSLRKSEIIPEKEAPLAADNVIATDDTDMAEDTSVGSVNAVESVNPESGKTYEQVMAEIDAVIEENTD